MFMKDYLFDYVKCSSVENPHFRILTPFPFCFADGQESPVEFDFDASMSMLTLRKPGMNAGADWTVTLQ